MNVDDLVRINMPGHPWHGSCGRLVSLGRSLARVRIDSLPGPARVYLFDPLAVEPVGGLVAELEQQPPATEGRT